MKVAINMIPKEEQNGVVSYMAWRCLWGNENEIKFLEYYTRCMYECAEKEVVVVFIVIGS